MDPTLPAGLFNHRAMDNTSRSVVMYPCRNFKLLNFACIVPDRMLESETEESWSAEGTKEDLLRVFHDYDMKTKELLK